MILTEFKLNTQTFYKDLTKEGLTRGRHTIGLVIVILIIFELPFYCERPSSLTQLTQEDEFRFKDLKCLFFH